MLEVSNRPFATYCAASLTEQSGRSLVASCQRVYGYTPLGRLRKGILCKNLNLVRLFVQVCNDKLFRYRGIHVGQQEAVCRFPRRPQFHATQRRT